MIGLGCMRLSEIDEADAIAVLCAALGAGVSLLDTADVYGRDLHDVHGNERLVARALASWSGPRPLVVTKAGLIRTRGKWANDGRVAHLREACERSRAALGVDALDALLLHAPDPRTPIETSARALAALRDAGLVRAIGLSNVTLSELDRARAVAPIELVEVAIAPAQDSVLRSGVIERCVEHGIRVLAHSPLGGPKRAPKLASDTTFGALAAKHGVSAAIIVLAWLRDLSPAIVPIPGARSIAHALELARAAAIALDDADRAALDARIPSGVRIRVPLEQRKPRADGTREVVVLMGIQGAGKSTVARELEGHLRLNRDELGGKLRGLVPGLDAALRDGVARVVLDNTYASRASRADVIDCAWKHGVPVRCVWLDTPIEVAQANVARRIVEAHGHLLGPNEILAMSKDDPGVVPPLALFRFRRELEAPSASEGFESIEIVSFTRRARPDHTRAGRIVSADVIAREDVLDRLRASPDAALFAFAWAPGATEREAAALAVQRARAALDRDVELHVCAHPAGPPICWCRPPLPGIAVLAVERAKLDVSRVELISPHVAHRAIADALGARFVRVDA
ncbi:aldo/keto reductase [Sandaracinus amylolyticus]|uniref:Oxidoreductase n=1 Tax=Sandaracinus amylolyticus TaxID=927083 RepID=A0A0F6SDU9_9BACT|nr:aldo/keto reductase [Sandaracinus amylolyticus]AKF04074.1 oxidoreductase [Sandaracinus amylolyticus]